MANQEHIYVTFGGSMPDGEIWQSGVRCAAVTSWPYTDSDLQTLVDEASTALSTAYHASTIIASTITLDWLKAANIGADGKYPAGSTPGLHAYSPVVAGGGTVVGLPGFLTIACTLTTTERVRGPGSKGRMFLPFTNFAVAANGSTKTTSSVQGSVNTTVKAVLNAIWNSGGSVVVLPSIVPMNRAVAAPMSDVTGLKTGNIIDTQRRRKNRVTETYVATTFP